MTNAEYRQWLIDEILEDQKIVGKSFTREDLEKLSIRVLEVIYDNLWN